MHPTFRSIPDTDGLRRLADLTPGRDAMNLHLVFPKLPPSPDGIGDYTARLAEALAGRCRVTILTAQDSHTSLQGVTVQQAFSTAPTRGLRGLLDAVAAETPDWLVVQYNPFSYGRRGFNPHLHRVIGALGRRHERLKIALMVHEPFMRASSLRAAVMTTWQRWQLWRLGRCCDLILCPAEAWIRLLRPWFPKIPMAHLPVGSNIPKVPVTRAAARQEVGVAADETHVVGLFGRARPARLLSFVRAAMQRLLDEGIDARLVYIGPSGARVRGELDAVSVLDAGLLPPDAVSRHFAAMDLYLAPFKRGVSTRRGSFMTALQHGIATISTGGIHTDALLRDAHDDAFLLAPDDDAQAFVDLVLALARNPEHRRRLAETGQAFYETHFAWNHIASGLLETLASEGVPTPQAYHSDSV